MKSLQNPTTLEMKRVSDEEARKLASYGWRYVKKSEYKAWQVRKEREGRHATR